MGKVRSNEEKQGYKIKALLIEDEDSDVKLFCKNFEEFCKKSDKIGDFEIVIPEMKEGKKNYKINLSNYLKKERYKEEKDVDIAIIDIMIAGEPWGKKILKYFEDKKVDNNLLFPITVIYTGFADKYYEEIREIGSDFMFDKPKLPKELQRIFRAVLNLYEYRIKTQKKQVQRKRDNGLCISFELSKVPEEIQQLFKQESFPVNKSERLFKISGSSPPMLSLFEIIDESLKDVSEEDALKTILIKGETGSGKQLVAMAIYLKYWQKKNANGIVTFEITHGAIFGASDPSLRRQVLIGREPGSLSPYDKGKEGLLMRVVGANWKNNKLNYDKKIKNGVVFLDEVDTLPSETQESLLSIITSKRAEVAGEILNLSNTLFIFATNQDLEEKIIKGKFRLDLYSRFWRTIEVPSLNDIKDNDLKEIINHILKKYGKPDLQIYERDIDYLKEFDWEDENVRLLEKLISETLSKYPPEGYLYTGKILKNLKNLKEKKRKKKIEIEKKGDNVDKEFKNAYELAKYISGLKIKNIDFNKVIKILALIQENIVSETYKKSYLQKSETWLDFLNIIYNDIKSYKDGNEVKEIIENAWVNISPRKRTEIVKKIKKREIPKDISTELIEIIREKS